MEGWTEGESEELLERVLSVTGDIQNKSVRHVESAMDWDSLQINNKTGEDCKMMFQRLINKVRRYRTMAEVIVDAMQNLKEGGLKVDSKKHPDLPKKPVTAYGLYVKKRSKKYPGISFTERATLLSQEWKDLPDEKKEVYKQKYMKKKEQYEQEMELFVQNHPEFKVPTKTKNLARPIVPIPSRLYQEARLSKIVKKNPELTNLEAIKKCQNKYQALSNKRKLVWIRKAQEARQAYQEDCLAYLSRHPNFKPVEFHLTREETKILNDSLGKPAAPPKNVFLYFINVNKDKLSHVPFAEKSKYASNIYRTVPEDELKEITQTYIMLLESYIEQYTTFYNNLPEEEKSVHDKPDTALKSYKKTLKSETLRLKKKKTQVEGTSLNLKRSHEIVSPEVASTSKKRNIDVPNTTANSSHNDSSTETNNVSSTTPKQKKKGNPTKLSSKFTVGF